MTSTAILTVRLNQLHERADTLLKLYHGQHDQKKHGRRGVGTGRKPITGKSAISARSRSTGKEVKLGGSLFDRPEFKGSKIKNGETELYFRKRLMKSLGKDPTKFGIAIKHFDKGGKKGDVTAAHMAALMRTVQSDAKAFRKAGIDPNARADKRGFFKRALGL